MKVKSCAAFSSAGPFMYYEFERRELVSNDVEFGVHFCGVCRSDLHTVHEDWGKIVYPCVPGHEIVGVVTCVGTAVKKFK